MAIRLTEGTKEYVPVTVNDRTGQVTDLAAQATNIKFDVQYDDDTYLYQDQAATASVMIINCLVDISATGPDGYITVGTANYVRLRLFVEFTVGTEAVRLGPVVIYVKDEP